MIRSRVSGVEERRDLAVEVGGQPVADVRLDQALEPVRRARCARGRRRTASRNGAIASNGSAPSSREPVAQRARSGRTRRWPSAPARPCPAASGAILASSASRSNAEISPYAIAPSRSTTAAAVVRVARTRPAGPRPSGRRLRPAIQSCAHPTDRLAAYRRRAHDARRPSARPPREPRQRGRLESAAAACDRHRLTPQENRQDPDHLPRARGAPRDLRRARARRHHHPLPIQEMTLSVALLGTDLIGQARTGTGKTLAFGIPVLQRTRRPARPRLRRAAARASRRR